MNRTPRLPFVSSYPRSKPQDGIVSRHLNRWLAAPITALALRTGATPNQVSLAIALLAIPMIVAGLLGHVVAAAALLQLASILDSVDGEIAREKRLASQFGALLDAVLDYFLDATGVVAIGLAIVVGGGIPVSVVMVVAGSSVAVRLISQYVVKTVPEGRAHLVGDTRDVVTLFMFIAALCTVPPGPWVMVGTLALITLWRADNAAYRMISFRNRERNGAQSQPGPLTAREE